ncbi:hypothetical protein DY000_02056360 [Brassica cretica]|uniref:Uncharacterized protein n=1 Tax=Brassica cretica TaxID=69181 RepID=A0ABQ7AAG7_BRACR|nr:hypothetical protein DY000_02056360 [Brassica cretica]
MPKFAPRRTISLTGVSALSRDLLSFETTSQVSLHCFLINFLLDQLTSLRFLKGLEVMLCLLKRLKQIGYGKILEAWKQAKPRPQTDEEAARLVITTLKGHKKADVEGLLSFYRLPSPAIKRSKLLTSQATELAFLLPHVDIYREISFVPPSDSKTSREVHANLKILE